MNYVAAKGGSAKDEVDVKKVNPKPAVAAESAVAVVAAKKVEVKKKEKKKEGLFEIWKIIDGRVLHVWLQCLAS